MDADAGIEVEGLRRAFGSVIAVDHLDLQARPGEVTAREVLETVGAAYG